MVRIKNCLPPQRKNIISSSLSIIVTIKIVPASDLKLRFLLEFLVRIQKSPPPLQWKKTYFYPLSTWWESASLVSINPSPELLRPGGHKLCPWHWWRFTLNYCMSRGAMAFLPQLQSKFNTIILGSTDLISWMVYTVWPRNICLFWSMAFQNIPGGCTYFYFRSFAWIWNMHL